MLLLPVRDLISFSCARVIFSGLQITIYTIIGKRVFTSLLCSSGNQNYVLLKQDYTFLFNY